VRGGRREEGGGRREEGGRGRREEGQPCSTSTNVYYLVSKDASSHLCSTSRPCLESRWITVGRGAIVWAACWACPPSKNPLIAFTFTESCGWGGERSVEKGIQAGCSVSASCRLHFLLFQKIGFVPTSAAIVLLQC
jgi:hypothetical protein